MSGTSCGHLRTGGKFPSVLVWDSPPFLALSAVDSIVVGVHFSHIQILHPSGLWSLLAGFNSEICFLTNHYIIIQVCLYHSWSGSGKKKMGRGMGGKRKKKFG